MQNSILFKTQHIVFQNVSDDCVDLNMNKEYIKVGILQK